MKELTKAEEQIMQILWKLEQGFVKDILEHLPKPKPAYNTVSTIVRILEKKGFVSHKAYGKTHEYYPVLSKEEYTRSFLKRFVENYFSDSFQDMVSFFAKEKGISISELEDMIKMISKEIREQKGKKDE
jgi:predicted transcriptional regulator